MAAGVQGVGLIATDATISAIMGLFKVASSAWFARLDVDLAVAAADRTARRPAPSWPGACST
jgi:hypothetical protein